MASHRNTNKPARPRIHNTHALLLRAALLLRTGVLLCLLAWASGLPTVRSQAVDGPILQAINHIDAPPDLPTDQVIITYASTAVRDNRFDPADAGLMGRLGQVAGVQLSYLRPMSAEVHVLRLPERMALSALQALLEKLETLPEVEAVEADLILQPTLVPNDTHYPKQWHYAEPTAGNYGVNLPSAWDTLTHWSPVVVAVLDTGITEHIEFSGMTVPGYDFITDVWTANDGDGRDADPRDPGDWVERNGCGAGTQPRDSSWHGTHTAGTIGAASNNAMGVAGINWGVKILPVRVLGRCGGYTTDIVDGMRWSAGLSVPGVANNANPAKVLNLSLGGSGSCGSTMQNAVNAITQAGATVVTSAGNSNADASGFTPANCSGVITVAASDRAGGRTSYSNYGSSVEITAPGGDGDYTDWVLSTWNTGTTVPAADAYAWMRGTSMAAPHVSGVASLLYMQNPATTPAQVLQILQNTSTPFPAGSTCTTAICGSGIVNAGAAVSQPTAIVLLSFTASTGIEDITLAWETASELFNLGFNLYRAPSPEGERVKLNQDLIPSNPPPGGLWGASYTYVDDTVETGQTYYYWLEDIDLYGRSRLISGPVEARSPTKIFLPMIQFSW